VGEGAIFYDLLPSWEKVRMRVKTQDEILVGCSKRITLKNGLVFT